MKNKDLAVLEVVEEESVQLLRVRAEITDGGTLHIREAIFPDASKYSYHWQTQVGELLLRWENAPRHPQIPTHPDHKHEGERVGPSARVSVEDVLAGLTVALKGKGKPSRQRSVSPSLISCYEAGQASRAAI